MNFRQEAYSTILKVLKDHDFSDTLLQQKAKKLKNSEESLALFYTTVKGVIKLHRKLDYILSQFTDVKKWAATDIKIKTMLYLGLYQLIYLDSIPDHAALNETVSLAKTMLGDSVGDFVNAVLRSYQRNPEIKYPEANPEKIAFEHSYPLELIEKWIKYWGEEDTEYMAIFFNENPQLHIRVNTTATSPDKLIQYFAKREVQLQQSQASKLLFMSNQAERILNDVAFSEGYFSVQDSSAAMIIELLDPKPEENILDLFAAPGGKCTFIAEKMGNTGEVVAVDKIPNKMKLLKQAAARLQLSNITQVVADAFTYGPVAPAYDRVLVDAPCSGWGVFGRKADLRWQVHQDIAELVKLQEKALDHAANFVKTGGVLVYSTCTMNPLENEEQVERFLKRNPNFKLEPASRYIPEQFTHDGFMKTIPFKHHMDGAFAAKMIKA
ncbi:MAG TPA: 16S rRNA (cytosine(967)-C(5))-methyltransferase RsmB [Candidatus Cloacimonadota bacterium]|nr:16S rRNA (cytosine(967)-C(5))-methyltransferase RsmB [Candidatus Cloacimonadota bacterium]